MATQLLEMHLSYLPTEHNPTKDRYHQLYQNYVQITGGKDNFENSYEITGLFFEFCVSHFKSTHAPRNIPDQETV